MKKGRCKRKGKCGVVTLGDICTGVFVEGSEHSRGPLSPRMSAIVKYISLNKYIPESKDECNS